MEAHQPTFQVPSGDEDFLNAPNIKVQPNRPKIKQPNTGFLPFSSDKKEEKEL